MEPLRPSDPRTVGPWQLQSRIGSGGMGVVYYANRRGQKVALKIVRDLDGTERNIVQYFKRELANLRLVSGPSVAALVDADMEAAPAWIAFEYIDGPNLKVFVDSNGPLLEDAWRKFAAALLKGISEVHARGVIHRDLKPSNIVIASTGPKLIDFGIAQALDDTPFTRTGVTVGTPTWMAPEQIEAMGVGKPADLFAAGSILLYAATGREPWGTGTKAEMQARICRGRPDMGGLSAKQSRLISALLIKDPIKRATAEDAVRVLGGAIYWSGVPWRTVFYWTSAALALVVGLLYGYVFSSPISAAPEVTPVVVLAATPPVIAESPSPNPASVEPIVSPKPALNPTPLVAGVPVAVVKVDRLNVRASAAADAQVVFVALRDEMLYVSGDPAGIESGWLPVYSVDKGYGWVAQRLVVREDRPASGVDYAIWLQHVHLRTGPAGSGNLQSANMISIANAKMLHQAALLLADASPTSLMFAPDGSTLAVGSGDGTVKVVAVPSGPELFSFAGHTSMVSRVAFSPDGKTLASGSVDNLVKLWDVASRLERVSLVGHTGIIVGIAFSPDGRVIASTSAANPTNASDRVRLWEVQNGHALGIIDAPQVNSLYFSPDGKTLVTGGLGANPLQLWSVASRQVVRRFDLDLGVWAVAISPDGKMIAAATYDKTVRLWDVATGRMLRTLIGHTELVQSVEFSPDGTTVVSASADATTKLWEVATGRELRTLNGHTATVLSVTFSPNGKMLGSGSSDGTVRLWDDSAVLPVFELARLEEKPTRWDPCAGPIRVAVNFGLLTPAQRKQIEVVMARSMATLSRHSGLEFVYSGPTLRHFTKDFREGRNGNEAIILDFLPSNQVSPNILEQVSPSRNLMGSSREWWSLEAADIEIDAQLEFMYWPKHGWGDSLILRRLLEASGLKGVNSQYEVMSIPNNISERFRTNEFFYMNLELGPGDILGLHAVGAEQGCIVD